MKILPSDYAKAFLGAVKDASREEVRVRIETLFALLRQKNEAYLFPKVAGEIEHLLSEEGTTVVHLSSAEQLSVEQKKQLSQIIGFDPGTVRFEERLDPAIGSGVRIRVGDMVIDTSTSARLQALRKILQE